MSRKTQVKSWFKFVTSREAGSDLISLSAKRLDGAVGERDSADRSRSVELQFAAPVVRPGARSPGAPQRGGRGGELV